MDIHTIHTEEYEEELKSALVCDDNTEFRNSILSTLEALQYNTDVAADAADTLEKMKFNHYDLIILNEGFGGSSESNEVYNHLQHMHMSARRHIFLVLTGQNLKTADNMTAFDKSANIVINEKDIPNLKPILKKSIAENELFYKVYKESLVKLGKR